MKRALIFAGQGQQFEGMGRDIVEAYPFLQSSYDLANEIFNCNFLEESDESLAKQTIAQPAILTLNHVLLEVLNHHRVTYTHVAGLSLGEYSALVASNVLSFKDACEIVKVRSMLMSNSFEHGVTGMSAILGGDEETIEGVVKGIENVSICNYNAPNQWVIGGTTRALDEAEHALKESGIKRVLRLNMSSVSHSPLLLETSIILKITLAEYAFKEPDCTFVANITGMNQQEGFVDSLGDHISHPTYFRKSIDFMLDAGVDSFIEVGPKGSLTRFIKTCAKEKGINVNVINVYNIETLERVLV